MSLNKAKKNKNKVKLYHSVPDRILTGSVWALLLIIMVAILVPLMFVLASSFSDPSAVSAGKVLLWPVDFSLVGYQAIFQSPSILRGFINSVEYTLVGTVISVTLTLFAAYPLSRVDLKIRGPVMFLFTVTMFFSGGMIPFYLVVKSVGLNDSIWSLIIPTAVNTYNLIIMRTAMASVPESLEESAKLDGANHWTILWKIMVPLVKPTIAVICLYYEVEHWNSWFNAMLFIRDKADYPLQLVLREILLQNDTTAMTAGAEDMLLSETIQFATIVVATLPILAIYPFVQRYFVKGVMIGAVKG